LGIYKSIGEREFPRAHSFDAWYGRQRSRSMAATMN
jgi:hypothetical protein